MKKQPFYLIFIFLVFLSCKDEKILKNINNKDDLNNRIKLVFQDTVYVNEIYDNGKIVYSNFLDTLTTNIRILKKNTRFIDYSFLTTKKINYDIDFLKSIVTDTSYADSNKLIPIYNVKFNKLGLNYIDGMITDEVVIANGAKNAKGEPMDRILTNEFRATKVVYVIKRPNK